MNITFLQSFVGIWKTKDLIWSGVKTIPTGGMIIPKCRKTLTPSIFPEEISRLLFFMNQLSTAFPKDWQIDKLLNEEFGIRQGSYYCPDYVIKIQKQDRVDYIIMDAKFSRLDQVKSVYLPCLAYKYLFSFIKYPTHHIFIIGKKSKTCMFI